MATERLFDKGQKIEWTDSGGNPQEHVLAVPFQSVAPDDGTTLYRNEALDGSKFESIQVGGPHDERHVTIRYEDEFDSFIDMLRAGINESRTLTYTEDGQSDDFLIVEPNEIDKPQLEDDYQQFQEITYELRIRLVNSSSWSTI